MMGGIALFCDFSAHSRLFATCVQYTLDINHLLSRRLAVGWIGLCMAGREVPCNLEEHLENAKYHLCNITIRPLLPCSAIFTISDATLPFTALTQ
jgi:hypothetical protein